jgi:3-deoxy-manno-octulosonate cytidylyltransferase (CMP-KDO synthetase)
MDHGTLDASLSMPIPTKPVKVLGVIPARLASARLPRKVLRPLLGEPLLAWVHRAAAACPQLDRIVIAADSEEVMALCAARGFEAILTSPELPSGSDRLFVVSQQIPAEIYVNIQGDEPLLEPAHITALLEPFSRPDVEVTTLKVRCRPEGIDNSNVVKVVTAPDGRALYFSRAAIPYHRDAADHFYFKHLGLYAYRRDALERFAALAPTPLELTERLEQLRLLENNINLYVTETSLDTIGVDTEEDLTRVEAILRAR